ncbi:MAG: TonB-dependent receptor [Myxococcota bacterium]|jgi:iron complex outermembrane receptor protein|nr:TonB-dependent receptor [Myxococcota bacterium]
MTLNGLRSLALVLLLLSAAVAQAEAPPRSRCASAAPQDVTEFSLEELMSGDVVLGASRALESVGDAPAIVTVYTREQITTWGYQSIAELVEHLEGMYVVDDHITPNVAIRGISGGLRAESGLLQVAIDGTPVSYAATASRWLGAALIPMSLVERVEIIRGPSSTVYGADAFLGVINIVTRDAECLEGGELRAGASHSNAFGGGFDWTLGHQIGEDLSLAVSVRLERENRAGMSVPDSSPRPNVPDYSDGSSESLLMDSLVGLAKLNWFLGEKSKLMLTAYISLLERQAEFADWAQLTAGMDQLGRERGNQVSLWHSFAELGLKTAVGEELQIEAFLRGFMGAPTERDRIDTGSEFFYAERENDFQGFDLRSLVIWSVFEELRLSFGIDGSYVDQQLPGIRNVPYEARNAEEREQAATSIAQDRKLFYNTGLYFLARYDFDDWLSLHGGVRYDYHNVYGSQVNGRVGATLGLWYDAELELQRLGAKVIFGSAFKAPTAQLLYGVPLSSGDILGNPELDPQRIRTVETMVFSQLFAWLKLQTGISYSYLEDKAEFVRDGTNLVARNVAEVDSLAWEASAELREKELGIDAYARFSWVMGTRNLDVQGYRSALWRSDLVAYPPLILHLGAAWTMPWIPLSMHTQLSFFDATYASDNNVLENAARYQLPARLRWDAGLRLFELGLFPESQGSLEFRVRNILDEQSAQPGFSGIDYPSAPRQFSLLWTQEL